ncbi:hypothetical protein PhCBS80983_g03802 [Powellomyces hirtus]|uniref:Impact N-terminal domain-containing protein n=1 Tax=Powellomyces hirtus TaxID=109895 RepID=A0A507E0V0_9FUNG|nr:hypothetical protein PhCBS80983_g03802 [Powellomyces hirtus]
MDTNRKQQSTGTKRSHPSGSDELSTDAKKSKADRKTESPNSVQSTLRPFIATSFSSFPTNLLTSKKILDRCSTFLAHATSIRSDADVTRLSQLIVHSPATEGASHNVRAWRYLALKPGRTGLSGPDDFRIVSGCDDDGEKWAGGRLLKLMDKFQAVDVLVVVSRWYGGVLLGPVRFTHIEDVAQDVLKKGAWIGAPPAPPPAQPAKLSLPLQLAPEHMEKQLHEKDATIHALRQKLRLLEGTPSTSPSKPLEQSYAPLNLQKAQRLLRARDSTISVLSEKLADLQAKEKNDAK